MRSTTTSNYDCKVCGSLFMAYANCGNCGESLGFLCFECLQQYDSGQCQCDSPIWPVACDLCGRAVFPGDCPHISQDAFDFIQAYPMKPMPLDK